MLRQKMSWSGARQNVLAQNVSNAQTPGYEARDIEKFTFANAMQKSMGTSARISTTHSKHINGALHGAKSFGVDEEKQIWETTPDGNSVVLEQQMMKMSENQMEFQSAINIYKKSVSLMKIALRRGE